MPGERSHPVSTGQFCTLTIECHASHERPSPERSQLLAKLLVNPGRYRERSGGSIDPPFIEAQARSPASHRR